MDFLKVIIRLYLLLIFCTSCAKFEYLYEQSIGQISLLSRGKDNKEVLKNVRIPKDQKAKIKNIEELKAYFYKYWGKKETRIYSQTTMLRNKAVTYLVIASPYQEIKPVENCFPVMGCFPYLGFFNLGSAKNFAKEQEREGYVTWIRPVYAYSTLGYFNDTILSSFFTYDDYELAELIFHELFHTIFFVKNNVDLNENLANYFSQNMLEEYFTSINRQEYLRFEQKKDEENKQLKLLVVTMASEIQELYKSLLPKTKEEANAILKEFMENRFKVEVLKKCQAINVQPKDCFPLDREWNNASLAAFLTYEKKSHELEKLQKKMKLNLREFYVWITKRYDEFSLQDEENNFEAYLFKQLDRTDYAAYSLHRSSN